MLVDTQKLAKFIETAMKNCYLGEFKKARTIERKGFFEMEYTSKDWNYRDSFAGYYLSTGQEVVRYKGAPIWSSSYSGGVAPEYIGDLEFFTRVEDFLRKSLSKKSSKNFSPRGPKQYTQKDWRYKCEWSGSIENFHGIEKIYYKSREVFYHRFFGGLVQGVQTGSYLSFLMGGDEISNKTLRDLGINIAKVPASKDRKLVIPKEEVRNYQALIKQKMTPGFWNEMMNEKEIVFIFKSKEGQVKEIKYSKRSEPVLSKMCSEYSGDSIRKTSNILNYLAGNNFYRKYIEKFYL